MKLPWVTRRWHELQMDALRTVAAAQVAVLQQKLDEAMETKYNVCQFASDGKYNYLCRGKPLDIAAEVFSKATDSSGARIGLTTRIILTDSSDNITTEWLYGRGITFRE